MAASHSAGKMACFYWAMFSQLGTEAVDDCHTQTGKG